MTDVKRSKISMSSEREIVSVLAEYEFDTESGLVEALGSAGGFSGARFWKIETRTGPLCLRRWPREHPSRQRLEFIHSVLRHVDQNGFHGLPLPLDTVRHETFVEHQGHLWELARWLPGEADFSREPGENKLIAAMEALAAFHQAAASFPRSNDRPAVSPGILARKTQLEKLMAGQIHDIAAAVRPGPLPGLEGRASRLFDLFPQVSRRVLAGLLDASTHAVALQPCIRDVWHDHVHFVGNEVVGFVDFGAVRIDNVAGDVARLLGSLAGQDDKRRQVGLLAYTGKRLLSKEEVRLVTAFDESGVLLAGVNWLFWVYCQRRTFEHHAAILSRMDTILDRLMHLAAWK